jgi:FKBP-type peptidyl-prolyl cis-trans isomerase FkpA
MTCYLAKSNKSIHFHLIAIILTVGISASCRQGSPESTDSAGPGKQEMAELNRYLIQKDREIIENYIERKNLMMTESSTGLWYFIKKVGNGEYLKDNDRIIMDYECTLIDGTLCYSSADLGPKEIILGKTSIETGLNEGLRMLKSGSEALFILPPFLAYGLVGDGKKIPPRTIILYSVSVEKDN